MVIKALRVSLGKNLLLLIQNKGIENGIWILELYRHVNYDSALEIKLHVSKLCHNLLTRLSPCGSTRLFVLKFRCVCGEKEKSDFFLGVEEVKRKHILFELTRECDLEVFRMFLI